MTVCDISAESARAGRVRPLTPRRPGAGRGLVIAAGLVAAATAGAAGRNLSFEQADATGAPAAWTLRTRAAAVVLDARVARDAERSLRADLGDAEELRLTQRIATTGLAGNRVRVSAWIADDGATPRPRVALWVRVDGDDELLYVGRGGRTEPSAEPAAGADAEWRRVTIEAPLADGADELTFGATLDGPGRVWLDGFSVEPYDTAELPAASPAATRYVERALDIMRTHSLLRAHVDWAALRAATHAQARGAQSPADTHLALQFALTSLGDRHSYFMPPERMSRLEQAPVSNARTGRTAVAPFGRPLGERIGYLRVPGFAGGSQADQAAFAGDIQTRIAALDDPARCGWVVDLRGNSGGNLWPMLAGLGPLLGEGVAGAALHPSGLREPIEYRDGKVALDGYVQLRVRREPYATAMPAAPLAVLIDGRTASSGEIVALFLTARDAARSFGSPTRGVATGTQTFPLSDGAALILTVATTADRNGRVADGPIEPDVAVAAERGSAPADAQAPVRAATDWITRRHGCR